MVQIFAGINSIILFGDAKGGWVDAVVVYISIVRDQEVVVLECR